MPGFEEIHHRLLLRSLVSASVLLLSLCGAKTVAAQKVDHYSPQLLVEQAAPLRDKAAKDSHGAASETLEKYGVDYTMLSYRSQDGGAEMHASFADIFVVVDGEATLLSGGELEHQESSAAGEFKGTAVLHGTSTHLGKGDVVHIPPNTPHQLLIAKGGSFTYFVIKVKEAQ